MSYAEFFQYKLQVLNKEAPNGEHLEGRYKTLGLIMCDLDYFKQVNDQYGQDVGDLVLKETAVLINKGARATDIVIRFGGEEF